jgi:small subunit ribosomal protein S1
VVVDLGDDIEGFVPASHSGVEDANRLEEYYDAADPVDLRVVESDATNRRIVLEVLTKPTRKPGKVAKPAEPAEAGGDGVPAEVAAAAPAAAEGEGSPES